MLCSYKNLNNKFERSVSLLCWAYNEELLIYEYLEKAIKLLDLVVDDYEIILIDDGSTDGTYKIAKEFQKRNSKIKIFRNRQNLNVGVSCIRAIKEASKEYLFWQTVDWSYDISNLRIFLELLKSYDIVQGVRRKPVKVKLKYIKPFVALLKLFGIKHITKRADTISKAIISVINYILIRVLFKIPLSDFQNVTFYPTKWIQSIEFESNSSFTNPEGLIKSYWQGKTIKEVPINFIPRKKGKAKGTNFKAMLNSIRDIFKFWFKWIIMRKRSRVKKGTIYKLR
jgi:glycosyltransferase involved in cell wall biosynthesis